MSDTDDRIPEDYAYLEGPCTCTHDPEQHDWIGCTISECGCLAFWTY